ncbi:MAG: ThiF family adenylyltransferase [Planctomycetaceae bacterium]|nr:ThiF family adenylyltransferase [Planctomycetaceae bacterium]
MHPRYRKQAFFAGLGTAGQERLERARAVVIGCGALGSVIAETLVRAGVGFVRIVDRDFVDLSNLQRQVLYDEQDVADRLPKVIAAERKLTRINQLVTIEPHVADVSAANVRELVRDCELILDGTDNFEIRYLLNDVALELGIPWINGGCIGSHGQVMPIFPGRTPCLRCLMPEIPEPGSTETCDTAGVLGPAVNVIASLQATEALKILSGQPQLVVPALTVVDIWEGTWRRMNLNQATLRQHCPACTGGERLWLSGERGGQSVVLCGRNSVQVTPDGGLRGSLKELSARLRASGEVRETPFLVIFRPAETELELTLFADGRAIVSGTDDPAQARSVYAQYIGS